MFDDEHDVGALEMGAMYALYRHGQDRQTEQILDALGQAQLRNQQQAEELNDLRLAREDEDDKDDEDIPINALAFTKDAMPESWDDYIGQEPLKRSLLVAITAAKRRGERLRHILLASGYPGVGKTTMARLIALEMGVNIIELVPPFKIETIVKAAQQLRDGDILFIDEIHKLADNGVRNSEIMLKVLEDGVAYVNGTAIRLPDVTYIGATTDPDKLPETITDRFKIKPYFQTYSAGELTRIAIVFAYKHKVEAIINDDLAATVALACRGTPRIAEEMILNAADLAEASGAQPTPEEVLEFCEVEHDGMTRTHIAYLTALFQYYARETKDGGTEFICGEAAMQQMLRQTKQGIGRIERFLVERGLIDRTPRGRRLTTAGIAKAIEYLAKGKGVAHVA